MKSSFSQKFSIAAALLLLAGAINAQAQTIITRANTAGTLNTTGDWTGGNVPGSGNIAQWDNTVSTAINTTAAMGGALSWAGINVVNPAAAVVIQSPFVATGVTVSGATFSYNVAPPYGLANGDQVTLGGTIPPEGFSLSPTVYFVVNASGTTSFQLSATSGGTAITASVAAVNITSWTATTTSNLTTSANTFAVGDSVVLGGTAPGGFTSGNTYFVKFATSTTVVLSATAGGSAITPSNSGTGPTTITGNVGTAVTFTGGGSQTLLTLGGSGINMANATLGLTINNALTLGAAETWNVASGQTLTLGGNSLNAGANALTIRGAGNITIGGYAVVTATGGLTMNGAGTFSITGPTATPTTSITTFTINNGIGQLNPTTAAIATINSTANLVLGGGAFNYQFSVNANQSLANLTLNPGESALNAGRGGGNSGVTFTGTVTRNIGSTTYAKLLDASRVFYIFNNITASTPAKDANGTPYMTTGNAISGAANDNFNDWAGVNGSHQVVTASYTAVTATSLGTSAQIANGASGVPTVTLGADATDVAYREANNIASVVNLNGHKWQTGGILISAAKATAGSIIKDTVGGSTIVGPSTTANSDIVMMIDANLTTPVPFTISAPIANNTGGFSTAVTKGAPGTLILSGNNTFTGGVYINDGILQLGSSGALYATTPNAINFDGSAITASIQNTTFGPAAIAPTLALAGNNATVASLSTANNLSSLAAVVENANGSLVSPATLTISGSGSSTFTGTIKDGSGGGTLGLNNSSGTQTLSGTLSYSGLTTVSGGTLALASTPSATTGYTVTSGTLDISALGTVTLTGSQLVSGSGGINGTMSAVAGTTLAPGTGTSTTGGSGILTITNLTVSASTVGNFGLNAAISNNCLIIVPGTLTLPASGTMTLNLYTPGTGTAFAAAGTYNLFQYGTLVNGTALASRFAIATSVAGFAPSFGTATGPNGENYITLTLTPIVAGVTGTWNTDFDGNWSDATKWSSNPSVPGAPTDLATLGTGSVLRTVTLDANESLGGLTMNNNNSFVIADGGKTLTLDNSGNGANVVVSNGVANAVQTAVSLNDNAFVTVNSGTALAISGVVANTSAAKTMTINGAGLTTLSAANTYGPSAGTVGTTLSGGGTVQIGNNTAFGAGDVAVSANNTVKAGTALTMANKISLGVLVNATVDNGGNNLTLGGVISGSGSLNQIGTGTLTLSGANSYAGSTTNAAGTLKLGASNVIPDGSGKGDVTVNGILDLNGNSDTINGLNGSGTIDNVAGGGASVLTVGGNNAGITFSGLIQNTSGTVALGKTGSGIMTLASPNTYSGGTTLSAGQLNINNAGSGGTSSAIGTGPFTIAGGTFDNTSAGDITLSPVIAQNWNGDFVYAGSVHNFNLGTGAVTLSGNRQVTVTANTLTVGGAIAGSGFGLTKQGGGKLVLTGNNTYSGSTTVNAGTLELPASGVINGGALNGQGFLIDGGSLTSVGASTFNAVNNALTESSGTVNMGDFNEVLNANDGILISLTGGSFSATSVNLGRTTSVTTAPTATAPQSSSTGTGLYVNGATANLGALTLGVGTNGANSSANARVDSGSLTVSGEVLVGNTSNTRWNILQVNGGTFTSSDTVNGLVINQNGGSLNQSEFYVSGSGTATVAKIAFGASTDTLNNVGWLIVGGGTLYMGSGGIAKGHAGDTANIAILSGKLGATADWSSVLPMQLSGAATTPFTIQAADSGGTAHNISLSGALSGVGALTKTGNGTLTLGINTYGGGTTISAGTLALSTGGSITSPLITIGNGATFDVSALSSTFALGASQTLSNNASLTGTLKGSVNTGSGTVSLTYDGTGSTPSLTVSSGTLTIASTTVFKVNNTGGSALTLGSSYKLISTNGAGGVVVAATTLPSVTVGGSGIPAGDSALLQIINGELYLTVTLLPTSVTVTSSANPSGYLDAVTFTATVNPSAATGNVIFLTNGAPYDTESLSGGVATSLPITSLPRGTNTITVQYAGDGTYFGSTNNLPVGQVVTNHPPVVNTASYVRPAGYTYKLAIATLSTNWSDADGDAMALTNGISSTNGAVVSYDTNYVYYTDSNNVADQVSYTVGDGQGGLTTGVFNLTIAPASTNVPPNITGIVSVGGNVTISFASVPNSTNVVQRTTNLATQAWTAISTNVAGTNGLWNYTDTNPPSPSFYRSQRQP